MLCIILPFLGQNSVRACLYRERLDLIPLDWKKKLIQILCKSEGIESCQYLSKQTLTGTRKDYKGHTRTMFHVLTCEIVQYMPVCQLYGCLAVVHQKVWLCECKEGELLTHFLFPCEICLWDELLNYFRYRNSRTLTGMTGILKHFSRNGLYWQAWPEFEVEQNVAAVIPFC